MQEKMLNLAQVLWRIRTLKSREAREARIIKQAKQASQYSRPRKYIAEIVGRAMLPAAQNFCPRLVDAFSIDHLDYEHPQLLYNRIYNEYIVRYLGPRGYWTQRRIGEDDSDFKPLHDLLENKRYTNSIDYNDKLKRAIYTIVNSPDTEKNSLLVYLAPMSEKKKSKTDRFPRLHYDSKTKEYLFYYYRQDKNQWWYSNLSNFIGQTCADQTCVDKTTKDLEGREIFDGELHVVSKHFENHIFKKSKSDFIDDKENDLYNIKSIEVPAPNDARLDTVEIEFLEKDKVQERREKVYIVYFFGNAESHENMTNDMKDDAKSLSEQGIPNTIIGFNYRGVRGSTGKARSKYDLVLDGIAEVNRLLEQGVPAKDIYLYGFSLGGAIAAAVAAHFHSIGEEVNLFSRSSFSTTAKVVLGWIRNRGVDNGQGYTESWQGRFLGWMFERIIGFTLRLSGWDMDAIEAWRKIPEKCKEYSVVRSPKSDRNNSNSKRQDDKTITAYASLHQGLKPERQRKKNDLKQRTEGDEALKEFKDQSRARKMQPIGPYKEKDGHSTPTRYLRNRYHVDNAKFFYNFVERTHNTGVIADDNTDATTSYGCSR